jgi:hypothetical protein
MDGSMALLVQRLRSLAIERLAAMYRRDQELFVFTVRREDGRSRPAGLSPRYTAITLIGLAREDPDTIAGVLGGHSASKVCNSVLERANAGGNLGDLALAAWAANLVCADRALGRRYLRAAVSDERPCTIVELSWLVSALCACESTECDDLRDLVAARLMTHVNSASNCFPHEAGGKFGLRSHVACFADLIYPVLALAHYAEITGDERAAQLSLRTARHVCSLQGVDGQWWWHYDVRNGTVVEPYPVYSVHQHAMAPMALQALQRVSHQDFTGPIAAGLRWLAASPELGGRSLIDETNGVIWRKVARREPLKAARYIQALATRIHEGATCPGLDRMFPATAIDYEYRPYELGWLLYAWPARSIS